MNHINYWTIDHLRSQVAGSIGSTLTLLPGSCGHTESQQKIIQAAKHRELLLIHGEGLRLASHGSPPAVCPADSHCL